MLVLRVLPPWCIAPPRYSPQMALKFRLAPGGYTSSITVRQNRVPNLILHVQIFTKAISSLNNDILACLLEIIKDNYSEKLYLNFYFNCPTNHFKQPR